MFWCRVARRVCVIGQEIEQLLLAEAAALDEPEVVEQHAFLVHGGGERRHRARRRAADIGMVAARCGPEQQCAAGCVEDRRHHRDVGQMRAAIVRCVERKDVARRMSPSLSRAMIVSTERSMEPRCTGMCGALATSAPVGVEHCAGEVEPLLDVHRIGGVLQRHAHLLGDRHEQVVEHFEQHRVGLRCRAPRCAACARRGSAAHGAGP
jgi:hypothetical protein